MYDIHTHLYWHSYDTDRDAVILRAKEAGVKKLFVVGCTVEESKACVALAKEYPDISASVGIHPQDLNLESGILNLENQIKELRELAKHEKVVAIGECGLEYYSHDPKQLITDEQKERQKRGFLAQIHLAIELELPLILHCRASPGSDDAYRDMFEILQEQSPLLKAAILHCYMGDTEVTKKFLTLPNVFFSFTGNITYPVKKAIVGTKDDLSETVTMIPLERIFTETDCPFLAPQTHRGERNEPALVLGVAHRIAQLHDVTVVEVEKATEANFERIFPQLVKE